MYSLWSRDPVDPQETIRHPDQNAYSTHPYIFGKFLSDVWFGVFINNAAAQDWWIKNDATTGNVDIKVMATGGIGDMYFFKGKNPNELTQAYHRIIGAPVVTPQWALGWHQSQWGYKNTAAIKKVTDGYLDNNLPLEAMWADIDYM
jgi:alpha-glucosidase